MGKHTYIKAALLWAGLISLSITSVAHAQLSKERVAAVSSVINMMLMTSRPEPIPTPDGQQVLIGLNELIDGSFQASARNPVFAEFELQNGRVEFCFDLSSNSNINASNVTVTFNETTLSAFKGKDNCYQFSNSEQRDFNFLIIRVNNPNIAVVLSRLELTTTNLGFRGLNRLTRGEWDERAVRKVLKVFAYGGHALDEQIQEWACLLYTSPSPRD